MKENMEKLMDNLTMAAELEAISNYETDEEIGVKGRYFTNIKLVKKVTNVDEQNRTVVTHMALEGNDDIIVISHIPNTNLLGIYTVSASGKKQVLTPSIRNNRTSINRDNTSVCVNELIWQFDRIANGLDVVIGQYNHYLPVSFIERLNINELFGVDSGDVVDRNQNMLHWNICNKIRIKTGLLCKISSYSNIMDVAKERDVTVEDVLKYKHIKRNGYIEVLE
ncbi:hypothetical protein [Proteiniborus sp. MB09-C3]|uniref:hypothetical protein n=1 Tax=Proteiniborus sp. MB09-C3 TaxID=3050072 RepID=UPI0025549C88|nr:hypothetical protein [Proteiniborus sp. MB09-C3]WIV13193.1 hypothetical protein QO263_05650 [Proteiniborus sp. MB09-C3]